MIGLLVVFGGFFATLLVTAVWVDRVWARASRNGANSMGYLFAFVLLPPIFGSYGGLATGVLYLLWDIVRWHTLEWPAALGTAACLIGSFLGWRWLTEGQRPPKPFGGRHTENR